MAKRKRKQEFANQEPIKYSLLVPAPYDAKIQEICRLRRVNVSALFREILSDCLESYLLRAKGQTTGPLEESGTIILHLRDDLRHILSETAENFSQPAASVVQLLLSEHLPTLYARSREVRGRLEDILRQVHKKK
jgi:hypothetical protein